jgi:hypothetical protein
MHRYNVHVLATSSTVEEGIEAEREVGGFYLGNEAVTGIRVESCVGTACISAVRAKGALPRECR